MKKITAAALSVLMAAFAFADDAILYNIGGSAGKLSGNENVYQMIQDDDIEMASEHVLITFFDDYYSVNAKFWFVNHGEEKTISVGFPEEEGSRIREIRNFKSFINGKEVPVEKCRDITNEGIDIGNWNWYVKQVHFNKNETLVSEVQYTADYSFVSSWIFFGNDGYAEYIYGTGKSWKGSIGKITIDVKNDSLVTYVNYIRFLNDEYNPDGKDSRTFSWVSPDTFRIEVENIEPESEGERIYFELHFMDYSSDHGWREAYPGETVITARTNLTHAASVNNNLSYMTGRQLRYARNDFYALHGRAFKDKELQDFYSKIDGYEINKSYSDELLTADEKEMIQKIAAAEQERNK